MKLLTPMASFKIRNVQSTNCLLRMLNIAGKQQLLRPGTCSPIYSMWKEAGSSLTRFLHWKHPVGEFEQELNRLHKDIPTPWPTVRNDAFTHHFALSYLRREQPRLLFISYGETDDFAHDGKYDEYILAANRTDGFIREVWETLQSIPNYRENTVLFITVDHGRGEEPLETWLHHASKRSLDGYMSSLAQYEEGIVGSEATWMAAMGPGISDSGLIATGERCVTSDRIAATLLQNTW
jgi:hypothetical protein